MIKIWIISDTHFCHKNIIQYCNRPFYYINEMDETMVERWNNKVSENDVVIHLGDFALTSKNHLKSMRNRLNGVIILVLGSHDIDYLL